VKLILIDISRREVALNCLVPCSLAGGETNALRALTAVQYTKNPSTAPGVVVLI